jgi:uncharacterized protein YneF (UPF0154 family)
MKNRNYASTDEGGRASAGGPYDRNEPIRVSLGVYIISLILIAIVVFIIMLVLYLPGYRMSYRFESAVKNADYVYVGIRIPKSELKKRNVNPLTKEDDLVNILKDMGAKRAKAEINPDLTKIPGE